MVIHKTSHDLDAKSRKKNKFISPKLMPAKKLEDQVWRMATWNVHGGLTASIKSIMVSQDLFSLKVDFVALQETQGKLDIILFPKGAGSGLGFAIANSHWSKVFSSHLYSDRNGGLFFS